MAYRRKIIDRRTREGKKLGNFVDTVKGIAILGIIIAGWLGSRNDHPANPATTADQSLITPARAAPNGTSDQASNGDAAPPQQANGYASMDKAPNAASDASIVTAMNSVPLQPISPDGTGRSAVPWRHLTAQGIRWSLRHIGGGTLLLIDLGADQTASVTVAPAFEALDLPGMNARVDHIRGVIGQYFPQRSASYSFERDGSLRILQ